MSLVALVALVALRPCADVGRYLDIAERTVVPPEPTAPEVWGWFEYLTTDDLEYLSGPRSFPVPCPWCGGRYAHGRLCVALCDEWAVKMSGGRHKGKPVRDLDTEYMRWAAANMSNLPTDVRDEIERVLKMRKHQAAAVPCPRK